jgi:hypothetical protein
MPLVLFAFGSFGSRLFEASASPRPENSESDEKDALFDLDTQITIFTTLHLIYNLFIIFE